MRLTIISPSEKQDYDVLWVDVQSTQGSFVIEAGHAPLIAQLAPGKDLSFALENGTVERRVISDGLLKVKNDSILVVLTQ